MKKMKLFPKTFLYTFFMLLFITTSMHLMIYFFYPKVYLSRMQDQLEKKMETLQQEIKRNTAAEAGQIFSDFAKQNNVNVTVECAGSEVTYMGMDFQISLYTDADMVFDVSNLENAESIIVKNKTMEADDGIEIQVEVMASAMPVKEAVDMITFLLPFTFGAAILFSIVFSYLYSRRITRPIFHMLNVTNDMKNLKPEAAFHVQDEDEVGLLAEQINQVYEQLLATIRSLDEEKEHMLAVEKSKTVFLRSASHELKTPITIIKGQLEGMILGIGAYKDHEKYLARSLEVAATLETMVQEILTISRLETNVDFKMEHFDCAPMIHGYLREIDDLVATKELQIHLAIQSPAFINGNKLLIEKVFSNLISNAIKYSPHGASVDIILQNTNGRFLFSVENTGTHIPEDNIPKLFDAFYRMEQSRSRRTGGSGLGLYMVQRILQQHNSYCEACNTENGVKFFFTI